MCDVIKKIFKVVGILVAIAGAVAGVYYLVTKVLPCKNEVADDDESDYVSCSCFEDEEPEAPQA
jgi:hypothetical protein